MARYDIQAYVDPKGEQPFKRWMEGLDRGVRVRVQARILRFEEGNLGKNRHFGAGLYEAKMDFGPGYRLYFGLHQERIVLLLCGGAKAGHRLDILRAKGYWQEFLKGG